MFVLIIYKPFPLHIFNQQWYSQILSLYEHSILTYDCPGGTCVFPGTKRGTEAIEIVRKEGLSIPVRALVMLIVVLMLAPTLEFHFDY